MGATIPRRREDGSTTCPAWISGKKDGQIVHREMQTLDRKAAARALIGKREADITRGQRKPRSEGR